ncbi:MAG: transporter substrate-binding domain-containing protein [Desulfobacterales bacterium]|nr:transporter substrate-binding domain-containing protein [Desulfobacterales bacterium]
MQRTILLQIIGLQPFRFFLLGFLALVYSDTWAHDQVNIPQKIIVGVTEYPPFTTKTTDGRWMGLSFELWTLIAEDIGAKFEIKEFDRLKTITAAKENKEVDLVTHIWVTELNETTLDISHAYYRSDLSIAVSSQSAGVSWFESFKKILSINSLKLLGLLSLFSL